MHLVILTQVLDRRDAVLGFFHGWCVAFARHVERLTVFAQRVGEVDLPAHVHIRSLGKERGAGKAAMLGRLTAGLLGLRGASRPDALWVHMVPRLLLYCAPVAWLRRVPMYLWYTHKGVDTSLRMAVPLARAVFTASAQSFRLASGQGRAVISGHGIDCDRFRPGKGHRDVDVLSVGRLAPSKGQDELLAALADLPDVARVEIAGDVLLASDASFREQLHERAAAQLGDRVRFLGAVPWTGIADVMRRARVLVNTSRTGSVDKVVLEAMACGTIPLTCNESFEDVFGPELAGRLMFPRERPDALAGRLSELLRLSDAEHGALGKRLRETVVQRHNLEKLAPAMVARMKSGR